jgi:RNAse (barnase) inhibitor barstar
MSESRPPESRPSESWLLPWLGLLTGDPPAGAIRVDGQACRTRAGLFAELARQLSFPSYFGHNWDALIDCLTDRVSESPLTLVIDSPMALLADEPPEQLTTLLDVLDFVARRVPSALRVLLHCEPGSEQAVRQRITAALPHD